MKEAISMTTYAVVVTLDEASTASLLALQREVADSCGSRYMLDHAIPPHVTLAMFDREDDEGLREPLESFAKRTAPIQLQLASVGVFTLPPAAVNALPIVTDQMKGTHGELHRLLMPLAREFHPYYVEPNWVPHCALAVRLDGDQRGPAVATAIQRFEPLRGEAVSISLVACNPYRELFAFPLVGRG